MSSGRSASRITVELTEYGFLAGAICGLLAFIPLMLVSERGPGELTLGSILPLLIGPGLVGAVFGALFGPILGWVNVRRVPTPIIARETSVGTVIGTVVGGIGLQGMGWMPVDSLIFGGITGAALATTRLRFFSSRYPSAPSQGALPQQGEAKSARARELQ